MQSVRPRPKQIALTLQVCILSVAALLGCGTAAHAAEPATLQWLDDGRMHAGKVCLGSNGSYADMRTTDLSLRITHEQRHALLYGVGIALIGWAVCILWDLYSAWLIYERLQWRATKKLTAARDLHDTLLQSISGLILRLHYASEEIDKDHPAHSALRMALQRADTVIVEGRERVQDLGLEVDRGLSLSERVAQSARELHPKGASEVRVKERGRRRSLLPLVEAEVWRLCHQSFSQFYENHGTETLELTIIYEDSYFAVRCSNATVGNLPASRSSFPPPVWGAVEGLKRYGHSLGLHLCSWQPNDHAITIELRFPASVAYDNDLALSGRLLRRLRPAV